MVFNHFFLWQNPINQNSQLLKSLVKPQIKIKDIDPHQVISLRQSHFGYVNFEQLAIDLTNLVTFKQVYRPRLMMIRSLIFMNCILSFA